MEKGDRGQGGVVGVAIYSYFFPAPFSFRYFFRKSAAIVLGDDIGCERSGRVATCGGGEGRREVKSGGVWTRLSFSPSILSILLFVRKQQLLMLLPAWSV